MSWGVYTGPWDPTRGVITACVWGFHRGVYKDTTRICLRYSGVFGGGSFPDFECCSGSTLSLNLKVLSWGLYRGFIRFLLPQPWIYKLFVTLTGSYAICFHVLIYFPWGFLYHIPRASPVGMTSTSSPVGASACWSPRSTSHLLTLYYPPGV